VQRDAFLQVLELHGAADFGQDREGVRIPLDHDLAERDRRAVFDLELGAVHDRVALFSRPFRRRCDRCRCGSSQIAAFVVADGLQSDEADVPLFLASCATAR
jgi:hypothetical protein